jgi:hypothetical protein
MKRLLTLALLASLTRLFAADVIVDNTAATYIGTAWTTSSYQPNGYNGSYLYHAAGGTGANYARFAAAIPSAGTYDVFYWLPAGAADRTTGAQFKVWADGTSTTYTVNEQPAGGAWIRLCTKTFTTSTTQNGIIHVLDQGNNTYVVADAFRFTTAQSYKVRLDLPQQVIWGLGVELQSDSIGSANNGLPAATTSVPHDLVASERTRLATDLIGRGNHFRYVRLALGLYLRGLTPDNKNIIGRWPEQMSEISTLLSTAGVEGVNAEYWSPAPYWKSNNAYIGGSLKPLTTQFLNDFANAVVTDLQYLNANGVPVKMFGLQNEPPVSATYSSCSYSDADYVTAFNAVAAGVRTALPSVHIHANSWDGQNNATIRNGVNASYVDAWTWHKIGTDSNSQITSQSTYLANAGGKPVYNNEFEYLDNQTSDARCLNTAQSIMNWFCFENSPTWFWLHALKPTYNAEAQGYALGYWRPADDTDFSKFANIAAGHFDYEPRNWRAIAGFLDHMPWNSRRYQVDEPAVQMDQRIMAFRKGGSTGKLVIVLTNRGAASYDFSIDTSLTGATFHGYRYSPTDDQTDLGTKTGGTLAVSVPSTKIEFWVEQ